jgi:hypothetical protein
MDRGRVGEDRGSKETDGCPLTKTTNIVEKREGKERSKENERRRIGRAKDTSQREFP